MAGCRHVLVTYTLQHRIGDRLPRLLDALLGALRAFEGGSAWRDFTRCASWLGSVRSLIEYFTLYPFRHAVFETNFRVSEVMTRRLDQLDLPVDAQLSSVVYRSVWAEWLTHEHDNHD
jgi:hypothetical protein